MSREMLKSLIELVPEENIEEVYRILVKFVPEVEPLPGEIEALLEGREDRKKHGTISHDEINWD